MLCYPFANLKRSGAVSVYNNCSILYAGEKIESCHELVEFSAGDFDSIRPNGDLADEGDRNRLQVGYVYGASTAVLIGVVQANATPGPKIGSNSELSM